ncbi:unnamed protein product [Rhizophagus irregularis]|nr:unnamed protein product [Rhizophagus irregularis]
MKYLQLTLFLLTLLIILVNAGPVKREAKAEYKPYCYYEDYKKYCPYKHHPYKKETAKAIAESDLSDVVTKRAASYQLHDRGYKNDHHGHHDHYDHYDYHHGHHGHHD